MIDTQLPGRLAPAYSHSYDEKLLEKIPLKVSLVETHEFSLDLAVLYVMLSTYSH